MSIEVPVHLNVYHLIDLDKKKVSKIPFIGFYHSGVEVGNIEYGFGFSSEGTGVFVQTPRKGLLNTEFKESILIGHCKMGEEFYCVIETIKKEYLGSSYDLIAKNCNHFSKDLCFRLCHVNIPDWINRAAMVGCKVSPSLANKLYGWTSTPNSAIVEESAAVPSAAVLSQHMHRGERPKSQSGLQPPKPPPPFLGKETGLLVSVSTKASSCASSTSSSSSAYSSSSNGSNDTLLMSAGSSLTPLQSIIPSVSSSDTQSPSALTSTGRRVHTTSMQSQNNEQHPPLVENTLTQSSSSTKIIQSKPNTQVMNSQRNSSSGCLPSTALEITQSKSQQ